MPAISFVIAHLLIRERVGNSGQSIRFKFVLMMSILSLRPATVLKPEYVSKKVDDKRIRRLTDYPFNGMMMMMVNDVDIIMSLIWNLSAEE